MRGHMKIHGHGTIERQLRGPTIPDGRPVCIVEVCRRYLCIACNTVIRVLPAAATARKHFSGAAIALALAAWGLCAMSARQVRALVNNARLEGAAARGWRTLKRWADDVRAGQLFAIEALRTLPEGRRECAARAAQALAGYADRVFAELPITHQSFAGALHVG